MKPFNLGSKSLSQDSSEYYLIAEVGVNHENNLDTAYKLIDLAKEGGADAVKFQTYKAERLASRHSPAYWDTSKEPTLSQFDLFKKYDLFNQSDYEKLSRRCESINIDFMSTAFDFHALEFIDPLTKAHKVASADLTNLPLLRKIASKKKPVILSTGASSFVEIKWAIDTLTSKHSIDVALLHCVLNYPTPNHLAFLSRITTLKKVFPDFLVGYSDHTLPEHICFPVVASYLLGSRIIEKHFTHDKSLKGNDHYHAMDLKDLKSLKQGLEESKILLGSSTEKDFLISQKLAISNARRSIVADCAIPSGTIIEEGHLTVKRPGSGISPAFWDDLIGRSTTRHIEQDAIIQWSDISN